MAPGPQAELDIIELDKERLGQADLPKDSYGDKAHPPSVIIAVHPLMPFRGVTERGGRKIKIIIKPGRRHIPHARRVDALTLGIQHGAVIEMEHRTAHKQRLYRIILKLHGAKDRFRLADGIIIGKEHIIAPACFHSFIHAARIAA